MEKITKTPEMFFSSNLLPQDVSKFLNENPKFLESYVAKYVRTEIIQKWQQAKTKLLMASDSLSDDGTSDLDAEYDNDAPTDDIVRRWKTPRRRNNKMLTERLIKIIEEKEGKASMLCEIGGCCVSNTNGLGFNLYIVKGYKDEISLYSLGGNVLTKSDNVPGHKSSWKIGPGSILAAYVAYSKQGVILSPVVENEMYPEGLGPLGSSVDTVIVEPVLSKNQKVVAVIEIYKGKHRRNFTRKEQEICGYILPWGETVLHFAEVYKDFVSQRDLNQFLLDTVKSLFLDIISMDTVIMKILDFAKELVKADRATLYLSNHRTKELHKIFDLRDDQDSNEDLYTHKEVYTYHQGVTGHVATTGESLNITDAYKDPRFDKNVDVQTGYRTKNILCVPIFVRKHVIGVMQMVNKLEGNFTTEDEEAFEMFAVFCGLALHHARLYEKLRRSEQKQKVALELMAYHSQPGSEEVEIFMARKIPRDIHGIRSFDFSPWSVNREDTVLYCAFMFYELSEEWGHDKAYSYRYDLRTLYHFLLTVRKNYRNVPYHNWSHAFSVAHSMYAYLRICSHKFQALERTAAFVAALCHDIDHRGNTNAFMIKSATPLAGLYTSSTMENHHFDQTVLTLQREGHNIFKKLENDEFKWVLQYIKMCILATDLALFFGKMNKLRTVMDDSKLDWRNHQHRELIMANIITACDLCAVFKPWELHVEITYDLMEEFWQEGDLAKKHGYMPIHAMMDRDKMDELPKFEVGFFTKICIPCLETTSNVFPEAHGALKLAIENLKRWQARCKDIDADKKTKKVKKFIPPNLDARKSVSIRRFWRSSVDH